MNKVLKPNTIIPADLYVERAADRQLRAIVDDMGRPGYVLVARQMGKTNLLLNMKRERNEDIVFYFDLSARFDTVRAWFRYVVDALLEANPEEFGCAVEPIANLRKKNAMEPSAEFDRSMRMLLRQTNRRVIVILDEIDSLVNASYSDSILAQIRSMYFSRVNYPEYNRLTYVLSGVAEPTDLIKDKNISPFNIGEKIYLDDFTEGEFKHFLTRARLDLSQEVLERVFHWARGNPRMTWDVCSEIEDRQLAGHSIDVRLVDSIVDKLYLHGFDRAPVDHIRTLVESDSQIRDAIVALRYGKADALDDRIKNRLYLAGITRITVNGGIELKNSIIDEALSDRWIAQLASARRSLLAMAMEHFSDERYDEAIRLFEKASEGTASAEELSVAQRISLGLSYLWTERFSRAAQELSAAVALTSEPLLSQQLQYYLGAAYVFSGLHHQSIPCLAVAIAGVDKVFAHQARVAMVASLLKSGTAAASSEATKMCDEVLADLMVPADATEVELVVAAYFNRAQIAMASGQPDGAKRDLQSASEMASPELRTTIMLLQYEYEKDKGRRVDFVVRMAREIVDAKLKLPTKHVGSLKLSKERVANVLANLMDCHQEPLATELLAYLETILPDPGSSTTETLLDLYYELSASEKRRVLSRLLRLVVNHRPADLESDQTRLRVARTLSIEGTPRESLVWARRYIGQLAADISPEALMEEDAATLMQLAIFQANAEGDPEVRASLAAMHQKYSDTMADRFPLVDIMMTFSEMQIAGQRGESELARSTATQLLDRVARWKVKDDAEQWSGVLSQISSQANIILSTSKPVSTVRDPFKKFGRNDRVLVSYGDKPPVETKFKWVESDLRRGECKLIGPLPRVD